VAGQIESAKIEMRGLQDEAAKTAGGLQDLIKASEELARAIVAPRSATRTGIKPGGGVAAPAAKEEDRGFDDAFLARMRKRAQLEREASRMRGDLLATIEQENQQRIADIQESFFIAQQEREQSVRESAAQAAQERAEEIKAFFTNIGTSMVSIFSEAFSSIGRLQNETTTEIVRNEEGMLEERTRITKQYVQDAGTALRQFLGDAAGMFAKAALNFIAVKAVEGAVGLIVKAFDQIGLLALVLAPAIGAAAYGIVKAFSGDVPRPPKFHTGGMVPGLMGQERLAVVQAGERVTSVADNVDGRGRGAGGITINNNMLLAPSRVQVERVNRDVLMPSARRLQRLGFA
jgi:hypothetical protein